MKIQSIDFRNKSFLDDIPDDSTVFLSVNNGRVLPVLWVTEMYEFYSTYGLPIEIQIEEMENKVKELYPTTESVRNENGKLFKETWSKLSL